MKLLMLHLSDIHFEDRKSYSKENMLAIVQAVKIYTDVECALIIISGDIAYSGKSTNYQTSWVFLSDLKNKLIENGFRQVDFAIVPGNHDVDYDKGNLTSKDLERIFKNKEEDLELNSELKKMEAFYNHANGVECFQNKSELVCIKRLNYNNYSIRLNLINTAVYSSLEEDQGFHYMPEREIAKISNDSEDDFVFSVMHHPHHWYNCCVKKDIEENLYKKSDMIFVGHEHYSSLLEVEGEYFNVKIYAGGQLANQGNWDNSEFYAGVLECDTRECEMCHFKWDIDSKIYIRGKNSRKTLSRNRVNKYDLFPDEVYFKQLFRDNKYMITEDFSDYYVFPRLEEETANENRMGSEITEFEKFMHIIEEKKRIILFGRSDCGKTVLLKQIFKKFVETKCVIYIDKQSFGNGYERIIRTAFEEIYSKDSTKYEVFRQIPKIDKVLLIDDVGDMDQEKFDDFVEEAEKEFDYIIYSYNKIVELDMKEKIRTGSLEKKYERYKILEFYKDKRHELVEKLVKIMIKQDNMAQENIINMLCISLSKQRNLFSMDPDFIVQFTKYYCNNIGETIQNDGEIFSKVFEANIVSLIKPYASKMSVDKILIVLDKIAYNMHVTKKYPMDQCDVVDVIKKYNIEFGSEIDFTEFLRILISSEILLKIENKYRFSEKTYLAYFIAREIKRKCVEEGDYSEFEKALEFSCYDINVNIILFVTYITDSLVLIRKIMQKASDYTNGWPAFSVSPIKISYLSDVNQLQVKKVDNKEKEENENRQIENEKRIENEKHSKMDSIYGYEEKELNKMESLMRSISLIIIISRTLPSFEHMMKREDKEKCVNLIYSMPLQIFNIWAMEVEKNKYELIEEFKAFNSWDYRGEKQVKKDSDALNFLRWQSISLLMEIMNASIGNATKENTHKFMDKFDYNQSEMYQIEHLMGLEHRDAVNEFMKEAIMLYESNREQLPELMIQRVARHFMLNSKKVKSTNIQRLNSKLWKGKLNQKALLINKDRNEKKEQ